jgi:hypothetical protein
MKNASDLEALFFQEKKLGKFLLEAYSIPATHFREGTPTSPTVNNSPIVQIWALKPPCSGPLAEPIQVLYRIVAKMSTPFYK